jgi:hypothetical protein
VLPFAPCVNCICSLQYSDCPDREHLSARLGYDPDVHHMHPPAFRSPWPAFCRPRGHFMSPTKGQFISPVPLHLTFHYCRPPFFQYTADRVGRLQKPQVCTLVFGKTESPPDWRDEITTFAQREYGDIIFLLGDGNLTTYSPSFRAITSCLCHDSDVT